MLCSLGDSALLLYFTFYFYYLFLFLFSNVNILSRFRYGYQIYTITKNKKKRSLLGKLTAAEWLLETHHCEITPWMSLHWQWPYGYKCRCRGDCMALSEILYPYKYHSFALLQFCCSENVVDTLQLRLCDGNAEFLFDCE